MVAKLHVRNLMQDCQSSTSTCHIYRVPQAYQNDCKRLVLTGSRGGQTGKWFSEK